MQQIDFFSEFDKLYNLLTQMIEKGYTIKQLSNIYKQEPYRIIDRLLYKDNINNLNAIKDYYNSLKIDDNKCLVISDTHIGRLLSNEDYNTYLNVMNSNTIFNNEVGLYNAYNYAIKNNIKNVIHAGDLIEGDSDHSWRRLAPKLQLEYIYKKYPNIPSIKTYLLYGNHDYNLMYYGGYKDEQFKINNQVENIGINYSYVKFNDNFIKISHYCSASDDLYDNIDLPHNFELSGHSHVFSFDEKERFIKVPILSSIHNEPSGKGFLELVDEGNEYVFKFLDTDANLKYEKVLSKSINNSYN